MPACLLLGLTIAVAAPAPKEAPKKDAGIVGEWVGEKATSGGQDLPVPAGGIGFTFTADGKLTVKEGAREKPDNATYKIDAKKDPAEIDLIPPPDKKEPTVLGIYKLDGDTLTLCFDRSGPGAGRPKGFTSAAGTTTLLMTFKRVKKD